MGLRASLTPGEDALVMAIYYATANSLSDEECRSMLQMERSSLLTQCQFQCEEALVQTNIFCMSDITVIKAVIFYIMGSFDRISTQSLWSLVGMTIRNAEKLGIHRDGAILGLSPMDTEERRRLWWQLQHIDLGGAVRLGVTPMTLTAGWDVKIRSNIEDEDLQAEGTTTPPPERRGLTSMSYNLFTYWVLDQQRSTLLAKHGRFELSWQTNEALPASAKDDILSSLEDGINRKFIQFCDPINPLHNLLQLLDSNDKHRAILLDASKQALRYNIALLSQASLTNYRWLTSVTGQVLREPRFIMEITQRLAAYRAGIDSQDTGPDQADRSRNHGTCNTPTVLPDPVLLAGDEFDFDFDMELQDIDWSFWSSID
ncbi:hypothetical protein ACEQ8H_001663 [Pleosporales sp. CAS-2024a]